MRRPLVVLTIALSAFLAACTSASAPGWTYAPPTEPPASQPAPSGGASAAPSPATSGAPGASQAPTGTVVKEAALGIAFVNKELSAPANTPFQIEFDNQDAGVPHNIEIKDANGQSVFKGEIFSGVAVKTYDVPALAAGTYPFVCSVHPNMTGTITVGG